MVEDACVSVCDRVRSTDTALPRRHVCHVFQFMTELEALASRCNDAGFECTTESRGLSWEGRELRALHVSRLMPTFPRFAFFMTF